MHKFNNQFGSTDTFNMATHHKEMDLVKTGGGACSLEKSRILYLKWIFYTFFYSSSGPLFFDLIVVQFTVYIFVHGTQGVTDNPNPHLGTVMLIQSLTRNNRSHGPHRVAL